MTKQKPIIFSPESVKAIIDGRKTQTRRAVKLINNNVICFKPVLDEDGTFTCGNQVDCADMGCPKKPRYKTGDVLWVKEAFINYESGAESEVSESIVFYKAADEEAWSEFANIPIHQASWQNPMFMPRRFARLFLRVTGVRCERLGDIRLHLDDAIAEGMEHPYALADFIRHWNEINGKKHPWDSNPWVWVYEFERIDMNQMSG